MLIVIPTAGTGSRLRHHTEHINKSMIQLGDVPVISKIIDMYPSKADFLIILGYKGEHIKEFLKLAYPNRKFIFVKVDKFFGRGSGLTYSLSKALNKIKKPFFFHANDTVFEDKNFYKNVKSDTMFLSSKPSDSTKYVTVEIKKNGNIIHKKLKYKKKNYFDYVGVAFIHNVSFFKQCVLKDKINRGELSYFEKININQIKFKFITNWFDIGSISKKEIAEKYFLKKNILPKFDQGIFFKNKFVYKFFADPVIINKRVKRAKILEEFTPKIIKKTKYFYVYKFIDGKVFSSLENKKKIFSDLLFWLKNQFWRKKKLNFKQYNEFKKCSHNFYYKKSIKRISIFFKKHNLSDTSEIINKIRVPKLSKILKSIDWKYLKNGSASNFHGDLHFENICVKNNKFILLDWRESFEKLKNFGDLYYDLAKLNHGFIIDHNIIKKQKFSINLNKKKISLSYFQSRNNKICKKIFDEFLKKNNFSIKKVNILTALIYLNIAPLHHYPYSVFLFYLGKLTLHDAIKDKSKF